MPSTAIVKIAPNNPVFDLPVIVGIEAKVSSPRPGSM